MKQLFNPGNRFNDGKATGFVFPAAAPSAPPQAPPLTLDFSQAANSQAYYFLLLW